MQLQRVHNRFGGMRDLAFFFAVIFGMRTENRGGKREFQLRAGARFHVFVGLGCEICKGNRAGFGISIFT